MRLRNALVALLIAIVATALVRLPALGELNGLSIDYLFWLRSVGMPRATNDVSPTAVISVDERTYKTPPFDDVPQVLWTPQFAAVLRSVLDSGAKVVGFDLIFPTSAQRYVPGFDRDFLLALRDGARTGRVVLGKAQHSFFPVAPYVGEVLAIGGERNVRSVNLFVDHDDVIRSVPLWFATKDGGREASFSFELARRTAPQSFDVAGPNLHLNFSSGSIPTYSLAEVYDNARRGQSDYFVQRFRDRPVIIGSTLDIEDRKLTSERLITQPERDGLPNVVRQTIPGVYVQATAVNNLLLGNALREVPWSTGTLVIFLLSSIVAVSMMFAALPISIGCSCAAIFLFVAGSTIAFASAIVFPMLPGTIAAAASGLATIGYRFTVADRDKRRMRKIFGLYLAPEVVNEIAASDRMPELGGERREMTFLFSDVADFTTLSEDMDPSALAKTLIAYLDGACAIIMEHGGNVNEILGDGIVAFFGAPMTSSDHVERALACAADLEKFCTAFAAERRREGIAFGETRIGIHSGPASVGNFGSAQRLKYTALGDTVNTASRIEGLNKYFGTRIAVSEAALDGHDRLRFRPLGCFVLKGKSTPLAVYELLDPSNSDAAYVAAYRDAYQALEQGDARAEAAFAELTVRNPSDRCVKFHLDRIRSGIRTTLVHMETK